MDKRVDICIIGAGPGGLSAAVNASSEGLSTLVLDAASHVGGQSRYSAAIENYLGFPKGITGQCLANRARKQVLKFGGEIRLKSPVNQITFDGKDKGVETPEGWVVCRSLVLACGLQWRNLEAIGTEKFGPYILYGGDKNRARHHKGKQVVIVGGGNSAGQAAIHWSRYADVTLTAKYPLEKTMSQYLIDRIEEKGIRTVIESKLEGLHGDEEGLKRCELTAEHVPCDAVIPFIGAHPKTEFAREVCECDGSGYLTKPKCPGVFVVGDCRAGSIKRVAVAVGEGAAAIGGVHQYLASL